MDTTVARLRYLNDSAHLLTLTSPSSAAAFQSRYDQVAEDNNVKLPDTRRLEICSACGFNMLSTGTYTPQSQDTRGQTARGPKKRLCEKTAVPMARKSKKIALECRACLSRTEIELPSTKPSRSSSGRLQQPEIKISSPFNPASTPSKAASTQNTRAKAKRTKTRNSLQAMLAKSKEQEHSDKGFGFDLMDLMKST